MPSTPATRPASPASPPPGSTVAPPTPSSQTSTTRRRALAATADLAASAPRCAWRRWRAPPPPRSRPPARSAAGSRSPAGRSLRTTGRHRAAAGDRAERRDQPAIEQDRRRDPADEVAQLGEGLARLLLSLEDELLCRLGIAVDPLAREAEVDGEHDQALLGAVVEVALDPVQLARLDVEDRGTALLERLDLPPKLAALGRAQQPRRRRRGGAP